MKKILINGSGYTEIPLILEAKRMGFFVVTTGYYDNPLGSRFADKYIEADYSNKELILDIVKKEKISYLVPGCNDSSFLTISYISEKLNIGFFDSYEISKILHHKDLFKEFALEHNISVPKRFEKSSNNITFPVIVKPVDMSGGKGTNIVYSEKDLKKAIDIALLTSKIKHIIIEEFIDGSHYSAFLLIKNKKIIFDFFAYEYFYINKFLVIGAYSIYNLKKSIMDKIKIDIEKISNILNLVDGLIHVQFVVKDNIPYILEVTRRSPGGLFPKLVNYSKNINSAEQIIRSHIGEKYNIDADNITNNIIIRHCTMAKKNGYYDNIIYSKRIKDKLIERFIISANKKINNYLVEMPEVIFLKMDNEDMCCDFVLNYDKQIIFSGHE